MISPRPHRPADARGFPRLSGGLLSSTCLILILPFALAARIDSISVSVVAPNGSSVIASSCFERTSIFARTLHLAAALAVVVTGEIRDAAGRKVRIDAKRFPWR